MVMDPLVSIIVPIYNASKYLKKCLDSLISQTYFNIEIICVNDGSTDDSELILMDYVSKDKRLIALTITNSGVSNARNMGMIHIKGDYVMFVDADDWLEQDCVANLLSFNEGKCDILMFPYISEREKVSLKRDLFDDNRLFNKEECMQLSRRMIGPINKEVTSPTSLDSYGTVWGKLYKRSLLQGLEFIDLKIIGTAEDSLFNVSAFKRAESIGYCKECYYHYRKSNEASLTTGFIPDLKEKWKSLFAIMAENISDRDEEEALQNRRALGVLGLSINAIESCEPKQQVSELLNDDDYAFPLERLDLQYLPIYWKFFFYAARKKWTLVIVLIMRCIQFIRLHG